MNTATVEVGGGQWPWRGDPEGAGLFVRLVIPGIWNLFSLLQMSDKLWEGIALFHRAGTLSARANV